MIVKCSVLGDKFIIINGNIRMIWKFSMNIGAFKLRVSSSLAVENTELLLRSIIGVSFCVQICAKNALGYVGF